MRNTTAFEKLAASLLNAALALIISLPVFLYLGIGLWWKLATIAIFYIIQVLDTHERIGFRCFGMRLIGTTWAGKYSRTQRNVYSVLYTLSFSTVFFHVYIPFDLLVFNLLLIQLPCVLITGTTLHGFLAGGMRTQISKRAA